MRLQQTNKNKPRLNLGAVSQFPAAPVPLYKLAVCPGVSGCVRVKIVYPDRVISNHTTYLIQPGPGCPGKAQHYYTCARVGSLVLLFGFIRKTTDIPDPFSTDAGFHPDMAPGHPGHTRTHKRRVFT